MLYCIVFRVYFSVYDRPLEKLPYIDIPDPATTKFGFDQVCVHQV